MTKRKKELLDFLKSRHYNNKELAEAEAQIDKGDYLTHDEVKQFFANKRNRTSGS